MEMMKNIDRLIVFMQLLFLDHLRRFFNWCFCWRKCKLYYESCFCASQENLLAREWDCKNESKEIALDLFPPFFQLFLLFMCVIRLVFSWFKQAYETENIPVCSLWELFFISLFWEKEPVCESCLYCIHVNCSLVGLVLGLHTCVQSWTAASLYSSLPSSREQITEYKHVITYEIV